MTLSIHLYFKFTKHLNIYDFRASLNDLSVLVTSGEEINPSDYLDLLNGNLVYLCEKRADNENDIVDCHGIGKSHELHSDEIHFFLIE